MLGLLAGFALLAGWLGFAGWLGWLADSAAASPERAPHVCSPTHFRQARSYLREALRRDRWAVDVRLTWANLEARSGNVVYARQLFEGAVRIDPKNADVWYAYEEMERAYVSGGSADNVWARGAAALGEDAAAGVSAEPGGIASAVTAPRVKPSVSALPNSAMQQAARAAREWVAAQAAQEAQQQSGARSNIEKEYGARSPTPMGELREGT